MNDTRIGGGWKKLAGSDIKIDRASRRQKELPGCYFQKKEEVVGERKSEKRFSGRVRKVENTLGNRCLFSLLF